MTTLAGSPQSHVNDSEQWLRDRHCAELEISILSLTNILKRVTLNHATGMPDRQPVGPVSANDTGPALET